MQVRHKEGLDGSHIWQFGLVMQEIGRIPMFKKPYASLYGGSSLFD